MFSVQCFGRGKAPKLSREQWIVVTRVVSTVCEKKITKGRWEDRCSEMRREAMLVCCEELAKPNNISRLIAAAEKTVFENGEKVKTGKLKPLVWDIANKKIKTFLRAEEYSLPRENYKLKEKLGEPYTVIFKLYCQEKIQDMNELYCRAKHKVEELSDKLYFLSILSEIKCPKPRKIRNSDLTILDDNIGSESNELSGIRLVREEIEAKKILNLLIEKLTPEEAMILKRLLSEQKREGKIAESLGLTPNQFSRRKYKIYEKIKGLISNDIKERDDRDQLIINIIERAIEELCKREVSYA